MIAIVQKKSSQTIYARGFIYWNWLFSETLNLFSRKKRKSGGWSRIFTY